MEEVHQASHAGVIIEIRRNGDLIGEWDGERIAQVVSNLVVNAIIHASANKVNVLLEDAGSSSMVLKVCNQGSSIPGRCWSPFSNHLSIRVTPRKSYRADSDSVYSLFGKLWRRTEGRFMLPRHSQKALFLRYSFPDLNPDPFSPRERNRSSFQGQHFRSKPSPIPSDRVSS